MHWLFITSILWGFTYGINGDAVQFIPPQWISYFYVALGFAMFFPFLFCCDCAGLRIRCMIIGAIQLGMMYHCYEYSFYYLSGGTVALLSVTTPLYVIGINDLMARKFSIRQMAVAFAIVLLTSIAMEKDRGIHWQWIGILYSQLTNFFYALGQIFYRQLHRQYSLSDRSAMAWHYLGALLILTPFTAISPFHWVKPEGNIFHIATELIFLGPICCGLGNYLWNKGIGNVSTSIVLIFNNLPIIFGILFSILFFGEPLGWFPRTCAIVGIFLLLFCETFRRRHADNG
jgi:drug/metabolite transporter (DMT)-like permease